MKESRFVSILAVTILLCVSLVSCEMMELGLEDYNIRVDPTPTTKHSVRGGPIEHGSPLNPYIPKLPPPPPPPPPPPSSPFPYPPPQPLDGHY